MRFQKHRENQRKAGTLKCDFKRNEQTKEKARVSICNFERKANQRKSWGFNKWSGKERANPRKSWGFLTRYQKDRANQRKSWGLKKWFQKERGKKRSRKAASSRRRCRKNGPGSKQGLCHLIEGLRIASGSEKFLRTASSAITLLGQLVTLELQFHQFRI